MSEIELKWKRWTIIMTCIQNVMFYYLLMCLKSLEIINSLKSYGLWSSHYLNAPSSSWDAMFKVKKIELITDTDKYIFF